MSRINFINESDLDEVDAVILANEDCDDIVEAEADEVELTSENDEEPDEDVADVMYDDIRDNSTTIEDMAAQDFRAARDSGIETDIDDDIVDIIYDEEDDDEDNDDLDDYDEEVDESYAVMDICQEVNE